MAVQLARPNRVIVRSIVTRPAVQTTVRSRPTVRLAAEVALRALLVGIGLGVILVEGHIQAFVGVATAGILAIGASLASWQS